MLSTWMRLARRIRPWMVAVALAGGLAGASACYDSTSALDGSADVRSDVRAEDYYPAPEYGPSPCYDDEDYCTETMGPGWVCGPSGICERTPSADADADFDCCWNVEYGPPTCFSDEDCAEYWGPGYVCTPTGTCTWDPTSDTDADADVHEEDVIEEADVEAGGGADATSDAADGAVDVEPDGPDDGSGPADS